MALQETSIPQLRTQGSGNSLEGLAGNRASIGGERQTGGCCKTLLPCGSRDRAATISKGKAVSQEAQAGEWNVFVCVAGDDVLSDVWTENVMIRVSLFIVVGTTGVKV